MAFQGPGTSNNIRRLWPYCLVSGACNGYIIRMFVPQTALLIAMRGLWGELSMTMYW